MTIAFLKNKAAQPYLIFIGFLLFYLITLSHNLAASHDSIMYINGMDERLWFFHPHHLLYHFVTTLWMRLLQSIGFSVDSSVLASSLNSIFGAATLSLVYYILRNYFKDSVLPALSTTILIGCSFGFWFYSDCVEVYIIPLFFLVLGLIYLFKQTLTTKNVILVGLIHGIAVLFHQSFFLIGFAVLARFYFTPNSVSRSKLSASLFYITTAAIVIAAAYVPVILWKVQAKSFSDVFLWLTLYAHVPGSTEASGLWVVPNLKSFIKAAVGITHTIIGSHFIFVFPGALDWFSKTLPGHELHDEAYLVRNLPGWGSVILTTISFIIFLTLSTIIYKGLRRWKIIYDSQKEYLVPILVWLAVFSIFFFIWDPSNLEFWIPQSLLFWILVDRILSRLDSEGSHSQIKAIRIGLPLLLVITNFFGSILYLHSESNDYFYTQSQALKIATVPGDVILTPNHWIEESYFRRYIDRPSYSPEDIIPYKVFSEKTATDFRNALDTAFSTNHRLFSLFQIDTLNNAHPFKQIFDETSMGIPLQRSLIKVGEEHYWVYSKSK